MPRVIPAHVRERQAAEAAQRRAAVIEDLEWIVGTAHPEDVAHRLGYASAKNLCRVLYKWGRGDLACKLGQGDD